jgi:hypothetical protein
LIILRIRDPETRAIVRGRLADMGNSTAVTENIWELARDEGDDPALEAQWWEEQLQWFEETIDRRTDVIYVWTAEGGLMYRSSIGGVQ